jgi:uncharacterized membrane protein YeaQ/YmgE (transglycosylase-associated protein family)
MGILSWIVFGLVVGIIAKLLTPGRDPGGFIITALLGIAGALFGGFVGRAMGFYGPTESAGWLMSIGGAILLLVLYRVIAPRRV